MDRIEELGLEFLFECFEVDFNTGGLIWKERPRYHFKSEHSMKVLNARLAGKKAGTILIQKNGNTNYYCVRINRKGYKLHRIIHFMFYGYIIDGDKIMIDHIDRNGLNNSIINLRLVTRTKNRNNCREQKLSKNNTSGIKGISFYNHKNKWVVQINVDKKQKYIGIYSNIEDAIEALKQAKIKYKIEIL